MAKSTACPPNGRGDDDKSHATHFAICGVALAIGIVLALAGTSALAILPGIGCLLMMVLMMWGMGSMHGKSH